MIIDFHTHVFPLSLRSPSALTSREGSFESLYGTPQAKFMGAEGLIDTMDEQGVDRSVIFGFPWEDPEHYQRHNDYILEAVTRYPDRLTGFCCFSPLSPHGWKEADRCLRAGLSGVGELALYTSDFTSEVIHGLRDIMDLCVSLDVPILFHTNEPVGHIYPGKAPMTLAQLYALLKAYPLNRIVLAHWGGGLFFYGLLKKEVKEVLRRVWFDTAASPYLYRADVYRLAGEIVGYDKILFGSDCPLLPPQRYLAEIESVGLSPRDIQQITGENAARLLGLPEKKS